MRRCVYFVVDHKAVSAAGLITLQAVVLQNISVLLADRCTCL